MICYSANNNKNKLQFQLMDIGNKLFHVSSSTPDILSVLMQMEKVLTRVQQPPSSEMAKVLHPIIQALKAEKFMKHPDVNVNISVVCCICEIIRIMAPNAPFGPTRMKEFFEVLVTSFEKQSSAAGGYRGKMTKVLEIFRKAKLPVMMLDVHVEGLVKRLFKHFLTSADSNASDTLLEMEKIMTTIIKESGELALELEALINATLDKIDSPVCWQLGGKVLLNCAAKLQPPLAKMEGKETMPSTSKTSNLRNDTTHKIKVECLEECIDTVQTPMNREHAATDGVNHLGLHPENGKKKVLSVDPPMSSKSVTEVTGKRKRNNKQEAKETIPSISETSNLRNDTTHKKKVECPEKNKDTVQTLSHSEHAVTARVKHLGLHTEDGKKKVSSDDPPMPSKSVTEVTGKRQRNNEQQGVPKKLPRKLQREFLYGMTHVQGYTVKKTNAPILEAIFKKHGDIASDCVIKTASVRESILEVVCQVVKRIQTNDVATIVSDMEEIEMQVIDAEATNMNVAWLRTYLEAIQKRTAAQKKSTAIVKTKANATLVKRAAKMDMEERRIELVTAQERFDKAERCVKVLDLVEMKLSDNFVESEAEKDLWPELL